MLLQVELQKTQEDPSLQGTEPGLTKHAGKWVNKTMNPTHKLLNSLRVYSSMAKGSTVMVRTGAPEEVSRE